MLVKLKAPVRVQACYTWLRLRPIDQAESSG